jgi:chorismate dehydratase
VRIVGGSAGGARGRVRLGAVQYLNARPHVYGLERSPRFEIRFDLPSRCAELLHAGDIDVGLIPSIEYLRGHEHYRAVPGVAIASRGPVESVALYTSTDPHAIRSIALDTSSRASVALVQVLCAREFRIRPRLEPSGPDLASMLARCDAALIIGDNALFLDPQGAVPGGRGVQKIDLGDVWTRMTGLPFVYAFWAGRDDALGADDVVMLQRARDEGARHVDAIARAYFDDPERQAVGARYLRDNIKYGFGPDEQAGLELFYRYAVEEGIVPASRPLRYYHGGD